MVPNYILCWYSVKMEKNELNFFKNFVGFINMFIGFVKTILFIVFIPSCEQSCKSSLKNRLGPVQLLCLVVRTFTVLKVQL
jgi:hypothetical protein